MAVESQAQVVTAAYARRRWGMGLGENRNVLGLLFMLPAGLLLVVFLTYPLGLGIWLGMTDAKIGQSGRFILFGNYLSLFKDSVFWLSVFNTTLYTVVASVFKFA